MQWPAAQFVFEWLAFSQLIHMEIRIAAAALMMSLATNTMSSCPHFACGCFDCQSLIADRKALLGMSVRPAASSFADVIGLLSWALSHSVMADFS